MSEGFRCSKRGSWVGKRSLANGSVTIEDTNLAFKLVLPKGTREIPGAVKGDMGWAFQVGTAPDSYTLMIQKLGAPIAREFSDNGAQIPLSRDAISVHLAGPAADDAKLKKALTETLGKLSGATRAR